MYTKTTNSINITVNPYYLEDQSEPDETDRLSLAGTVMPAVAIVAPIVKAPDNVAVPPIKFILPALTVEPSIVVAPTIDVIAPVTSTLAPEVKEDPAPSADWTAAQALRTPAFWFISFGHGFTSMVLLAIMAHLGLLMEDAGFSVQTTAWLVSLYTAVAMVFQLVGGYLGDRISKRIALFIFSSLQAAGVVVLAFSTSTHMLILFAILFGIGFGGRNPLTVAIRGDYFGQASFGKILGLSTVPMNILMLLAPPFAGWMRDTRGDYTTAFLILAGFGFLGGICFLFAKRPEFPLSA